MVRFVNNSFFVTAAPKGAAVLLSYYGFVKSFCAWLYQKSPTGILKAYQNMGGFYGRDEPTV